MFHRTDMNQAELTLEDRMALFHRRRTLASVREWTMAAAAGMFGVWLLVLAVSSVSGR